MREEGGRVHSPPGTESIRDVVGPESPPRAAGSGSGSEARIRDAHGSVPGLPAAFPRLGGSMPEVDRQALGGLDRSESMREVGGRVGGLVKNALGGSMREIDGRDKAAAEGRAAQVNPTPETRNPKPKPPRLQSFKVHHTHKP